MTMRSLRKITTRVVRCDLDGTGRWLRVYGAHPEFAKAVRAELDVTHRVSDLA
ncbi:MAG: hypothetical protein ACI91O_001394 [Candidatus Poriferisodalaceae bacterium]|jgi:hypothetical protein